MNQILEAQKPASALQPLPGQVEVGSLRTRAGLKTYLNTVDGRLVPATRTFESNNPATGEAIGLVPTRRPTRWPKPSLLREPHNLPGRHAPMRSDRPF